MKRLLTACLFLSLVGASAGIAAKKKDDAPMAKVEAHAFDAQRDTIVRGFESGERYSEISAPDKEKVLAALDEMERLLGDKTSIDALRPDAKVALFNEQETINTILTAAQADSREVCKRSRPINSRIPVNECHTVAEWQRRRDEARDLMDERQRLLTRPLPVRPPGG